MPAEDGVTSCVPESATTPLQAPLAWQLPAFELDQVSVVVSPAVSAVGLAPMLTMTGFAEEEEEPAGASPPPPPPLQDAISTQAATTAKRFNARRPR